ncbi:MAG: putative sulfate exporter family transporter, partial [Gammaproteobacteria bacterium]|nr:putative sulfate exporter family transporter [Gammaproteobacteria bacterium]
LPVPSILLQGAAVTSKALLVCALFLVGTELTRDTLGRIRGPTLWQGLLLWLTVAPLSLLAIRLLH